MEKVFIISAVRTPLGSFGGVLSELSATELGSIAIRGALNKAGVTGDQIDEVFFGNVVQASSGQAPARQAALKAGISINAPCTTINKVCASGMKAIAFGAQAIQLGQAKLIVAGGMESMSNIPFYLPKARYGYKYGDGVLIDGLINDGLLDAYGKKPMGVYADETAAEYNISREEQDNFAIESYKRSAFATENGFFKNEIEPVELKDKKGNITVIDTDEEFKKVSFEKIPSLRAVFTKEGTVTAANASTINDGAAALVLASESAVKEFNLNPIAEIIAYGDAAHEPERFTTAPVKAANKILKQSGLKKEDIDLWEVNEAFAVVTLAFNKSMGIDNSIVNVNGGAVSLGHPLGASGARIVVTLAHALKAKGKKTGLATLCNGGGGAGVMIIRSV
ncbi:MAG: thiolase family protein [Saprospiraceae bacterium]|nr:thiolase family protein [Saprospiraceae bacterium]